MMTGTADDVSTGISSRGQFAPATTGTELGFSFGSTSRAAILPESSNVAGSAVSIGAPH